MRSNVITLKLFFFFYETLEPFETFQALDHQLEPLNNRFIYFSFMNYYLIRASMLIMQLNVM